MLITIIATVAYLGIAILAGVGSLRSSLTGH
jgi:hypothetical protein